MSLRGSAGSELLAHYAAMSKEPAEKAESSSAEHKDEKVEKDSQPKSPPREIGGRDGPEPTRFGDWEKAGRCIDF